MLKLKKVEFHIKKADIQMKNNWISNSNLCEKEHYKQKKTKLTSNIIPDG